MPTICVCGPDGCGKSTVIEAIGEWCQITGREHVIAHNPGSTNLGKLLRRLIKDPGFFGEVGYNGIVITPLVERLLLLCDNAAFIDTIHRPNQDKWVIMDRSNFISDIAYGQAAGVDMEQMKKLHSLIKDPPKIDQLFILKCDFETAKARRTNRKSSEKCRIEDNGDVFFKKVHHIYDKLLEDYNEYLQNFVAVENGKLCAEYVEASSQPGEVVSTIISRLGE